MQDAGRSAQDPVKACRSYLSEALAPMVVGAAIIRCRPSTLVVNMDDSDAVRVRSAEARGAGKP